MNLLSLKNLKQNPLHKWHKSIIMGKEYNLISDCWSVIDILLEDK